VNIEKELQLAKKYKKNNNIDAAREIYTKVLELHPNSKKAKQGLKSLSSDNNRTKSTSIDLSMEQQNQLVSLYQSNRIEDAIKETSRLIGLYPKHPFLYNFLGLCFQSIGQNQNAINSFIKSLEIKPDYFEGYYNLGNLLKSMGNTDKAIVAYEEALKIEPRNSTILKELGNIKDFSQDNQRIQFILDIYKNTKDAQEQIEFGYILFKIADKLGQYDNAFQFLEKSNHLKLKTSNYDVDDHISYIENVKSLFENSDIENIKTSTNDNSKNKTIFIVGMPRSGTTLTEQILASHNDVTALGEQNFMTTMINNLIQNNKEKIVIKDIQNIQELYLKEQSKLGSYNTKYLTDKTPHNFIYIGFILLAFPNAKIINLSRDPIANAWSLYKTYFTADGLGYSYDFDDIAEFYKVYTDIFEFYNEKFPDQIYTLKYESLVEDQETATKDLLAYCELEWEDSCMEFYNTTRAISTASSQQVRKSIYDDSLSEWKNYKEDLKPLIQSLEEQGVIS